MKFSVIGLFLVSLLGLSLRAQAALGDAVVQTSSTSSTTKKTTSAGSTYSTVEATSSEGLFTRQYLDANGVVFAIAWRGPSLPDLADLFGDYTNEYKATVKSKGLLRGRRQLNVSTSSITVVGGGRDRDQFGIAYVFSKLPDGFDVKDISYED